MTAKEKISQYIDKKGITKRDFYRQTGLSNGFLDSGDHIGTNNLKIIIEKFPDLNVEWVVLDEGEMLKIKPEVNFNPQPLFLSEPLPAYNIERDNLDTISMYLERINSYTKEIETLINIERLQKQKSDTKSDKSRTKSGEK